MEQYNIYFKKFKIAIGIALMAVVLLGFLISKIVPSIQNIFKTQSEYKSQVTALADAKRKLENIKNDEQRNEAVVRNVSKAFFRPITEGLDTEAAISDEFGEILQLIRENKIKTRLIKYDYDPEDDNFVKNAPRRFNVCRVSANLIATYTQFENFLRDLYKHEHFLEVSSIEITPYDKDKRILLINFVMKLYAQKDSFSSQSASPQDVEASNP